MKKIIVVLIGSIILILGTLYLVNKNNDIIETQEVDSFINEFDNYECPGGECKG